MTQPQLVIPNHLEVAAAAEQTLSNGTKLYTLRSEEFEVVRISFVFAAGTSTQRHPFVASSVANMLSEGSHDLSAQQIAEQLDYYGSFFDVNIDRDYVYINFCTLEKFVTPTLQVAEQILLYPTFDPDELTTYAQQRKQRLTVERTKVETKAREIFAQSIFSPTHPYGISSDQCEYDNLTQAKLEEHYNSYYTAQNCFVVCSGKLSDSTLAAIEAVALKLKDSNSATECQFPAPKTKHFTFAAHPNAVQSSIRMGRLLFTRNHPDFVGMQVVASILGGYFSSRLMHNLREEHGYTYGVVSAMVNFQREGYLAIATQVGTEVTVDALHQIFTEIEILRTTLMSDEELSLVKNIMIGEILRILDGPFGIADVTIENIMCNKDNSIIDKNIQIIKSITPEHIQELAHKYLAPQEMCVVVVGAPELESPITELYNSI